MRRSPLLVLLVSLFLVGCGSDDGDDGDSLSKDEFIDRGDTLCRDYEEEASGLPDPQTVEELTALLETASMLTSEFRDDVAALDPPQGEGERIHRAFLDAIDETVVKIDESLAASREGDVEAAGARFDEASAAASSVDEQLIDYGFDDCANGDGS